MTIFEKIYFTLFIINFVLMFVGLAKDNDCLENLFVEQLGLTIVYEFIRLILFIWGVSVDLFPSIF